jgi:hypothetical protein
MEQLDGAFEQEGTDKHKDSDLEHCKQCIMYVCMCPEFLTHQQEDAWVEKEGGRALAGTRWEVALCREMQKVEAALLETTDNLEAFSPDCLVMLKPACMNILTHWEYSLFREFFHQCMQLQSLH